MSRIILTAVILLQAICAWAQAPVEGDFRVDHRPGSEASLLTRDQPLWTYHFDAKGGVPYFHPLALPDGTVLTAFAPQDHPWHRGLWFSWKFLNGVNYWDWEGRKEAVPDGTTERVGAETVGGGGKEPVVIEMTLQYRHKDDVVLTEKRSILAGLPRPDGSYVLDWQATFTAPKREVVLDRTSLAQAPWGGYAGFSYRATRAMQDVRVLDSEGREGKQGHGKQARWMDFSGAVGKNGPVAGVTIFDHPKNPRYPTPWFVETQGIQYFGPALLFHEPLKLPAGQSFTLHYRVMVHPGRCESAVLNKECEAFCRTP
jgi:hypothetical protein